MAAVVVAASTVIGGCTTTVPGTPTAADPTGSASARGPGSEKEWAKELATEFAELRKVDPCTLLDRDVIQAIAGATAGIYLPGQHLSECRVDTDIDDHTPGWGFSVDVGALYDTKKTTAREEKVNNETFYVAGDEMSCSYTRMVTDIIAVQLSVWTPPFTDTSGDPCEMGKSYLTKAMTSFTDMGRRGQKRTEPQLPLATHDPCEAVPEVAKAMDTDATGVPIRTYLCSIDPPEGTDDSPLTGQHLSIAYEFTADPRDDAPDDPDAAPPPGTEGFGTLTAITIAGHSGTQFDGAGDVGCGVDLVLDDETTLQNGTVTMVQVVSVLSDDCDITAKVADAVITKLDPA